MNTSNLRCHRRSSPSRPPTIPSSPFPLSLNLQSLWPAEPMAHGSSTAPPVVDPCRDRVQVMELFCRGPAAARPRAQLPRSTRRVLHHITPKRVIGSRPSSALIVLPVLAERSSSSPRRVDPRSALNTWSMEPDFAAFRTSVHGLDSYVTICHMSATQIEPSPRGARVPGVSASASGARADANFGSREPLPLGPLTPPNRRPAVPPTAAN